jgi:nickel-dependent lactate racemase
MQKRIPAVYMIDGVRVQIPNRAEVVTLQEGSSVSDIRTEIRRALNNPIGCAPIRELARGKSDAVIIINDTTRPTPSDLMLEALLADLAKAGIRETDVTVIIACGNHRPNTREEIRRMVGNDLAARLHIINHDCNDGGSDCSPHWCGFYFKCGSKRYRHHIDGSGR